MKVGIVGAGIMGRLLAFGLLQAGHQVSLYDQDTDAATQSCSIVAAGLLTPVMELEKAEMVIYQLGQEALQQHWPALLAQLEPVYFRKNGTIVFSHPQDRADLMRFIGKIDAKLPGQYQVLERPALAALEPTLAKFNEGFYFQDEGHFDNQQLLTALTGYLRGQAIDWHENCVVESINPREISIKNEIYQFDLVCDCRGLGAKTTFPDLQGIRGEVIWLHAPEVNLQRPVRFLHPRYSLYIVPRPNHVFVVGTSEIPTEDASPISVRTTLEFLSACFSLHPGFAEARIIATHTACRPTLPDHLPKIKYSDGFIAINGLYRHGFLIGPTLLKEVLTHLQHGLSAVRYPQLWERRND